METRKKTSPIWAVSREEFVDLVSKSRTLNDILSCFGMRNMGGNHNTFWRRVRYEQLDEERIRQRFKDNQREALRVANVAVPDIDVFVENSTYSRTHLKRRIILKNLIPYTCSGYGLGSQWNSKPLALQLEHINGVFNDNRLSNLCFLCPNCHSQTETFAGRKNRAA